MITSQIEEEERLTELRRTQAALLEKQEKNDKKKENEQFLDSLVISVKRLSLIGFSPLLASVRANVLYDMLFGWVHDACIRCPCVSIPYSYVYVPLTCHGKKKHLSNYRPGLFPH